MSDKAVTAEVGQDVVDARPLVAMTPSSRGLWLFAGAALLGSTLLFAALESRRAARDTNAALPTGGTNADGTAQMIAAPPALAIPPEVQDYAPPSLAAYPSPQPVVTPPAAPVRLVRVPSTGTTPLLSLPSAQPSLPSGPAVVFRAPEAKPDTRPETNEALSSDAVKTGNRALAAHFANPSLTVPQGTVIQAVMETALDSSRAGFARAIISRDVRGFDGSRVLIPRGSRLLGNYKADLAQGQSRAFIQWERLMRTDGAIIAVNSPAADPLGRAGIGGKVNTHFFQRFGGALLQSSLDLGVGLASRSLSGGNVVVALPGSAVTNSTKDLVPTDIKPTLKSPQGTSVSVFVARDLDFSTVDP